MQKNGAAGAQPPANFRAAGDGPAEMKLRGAPKPPLAVITGWIAGFTSDLVFTKLAKAEVTRTKVIP